MKRCMEKHLFTLLSRPLERLFSRCCHSLLGVSGVVDATRGRAVLNRRRSYLSSELCVRWRTIRGLAIAGPTASRCPTREHIERLKSTADTTLLGEGSAECAKGSMRVARLLLACSLVMGLLPAVGEAGEEREGPESVVDFVAEVQPILSDNCFFCHGPDPEDRHADLRLDIAEGEQGGVELGAIVPGDRDSSYLWQRINDPEDPMPPIDSHKSLSREQIEIIGRWIDQGAEYEQHWAYAPITKPEPDATADGGWGGGAIDRFLHAKMREKGLRPSPDATPERLLRRVYLDLTGLPPTAEQLRSFMSDPSDAAYARVVEELLASPRFGEHWAAWWLDLVRYGDSVGFHGDQSISVWPYREWVITAFNKNMPFDRFSRMQLAGDLLHATGRSKDDGVELLLASAYNRLTPVTAEGGAQQEEYRAIYAAERVSNFGEVWLASSTRCCQCHDHKYDPYTAEDFYSLAAVFSDIDHAIISSGSGNPGWAPFCFLPESDEQTAKVEELDQRYEAILAANPEAGAYESWFYSRDAGAAPPHGPWAKELKEVSLERSKLAAEVPYSVVTRPLPEPRPVRFLPRGNWQDESGEVMSPRAPEFLGGESGGERFDRLALANWLFTSDNPLTSRVLVNRLWSRFFGRGISSNTLDFGNQGEPPTHRDLLDWLASTFVESGWDLQHVMRLMVTSRAYRQSSAQPPDLVSIDPSNQWFARQSAVRLPAEVVRDQALAASGLLVNRLGGKSVYPYQPARHWAALNFPKRGYPQSHGEELYRRSVYTWVQRTFPHPAMTVFDAPNRESCTAKRAESNTPLQALTLLNETLSVEAARHLAQRQMRTRREAEVVVRAMFEQVLLRPATAVEMATLMRLYVSQESYFGADPARATALCAIGESDADSSLPVVKLAAATSVARVIFNLHETVTRP